MSKWKITLSPVASGLCPQPFADMARSLRRNVPACFDLRQAKALIDLAYSDCKLRRGSEETTAMTTMWPKVALFNYFAVEMPFAGEAVAKRLPLDWVSICRIGLQLSGSE